MKFEDYKIYNTKAEAYQTGANEVWSVQMFESERGWGGRIDDTHYFIDKVEADRFVHDYNKTYNNHKVVPDWYIMAMSPTLV